MNVFIMSCHRLQFLLPAVIFPVLMTPASATVLSDASKNTLLLQIHFENFNTFMELTKVIGSTVFKWSKSILCLVSFTFCLIMDQNRHYLI